MDKSCNKKTKQSLEATRRIRVNQPALLARKWIREVLPTASSTETPNHEIIKKRCDVNKHDSKQAKTGKVERN